MEFRSSNQCPNRTPVHSTDFVHYPKVKFLSKLPFKVGWGTIEAKLAFFKNGI